MNKKQIVNILELESKNNPVNNKTSLIQSAIDICKKQGGGTVYFPPGNYISGTIRIYDNIELYLENGANLKASPDPDLYVKGNKLRDARLIIADNCTNIGIVGPGSITGTGQEELQRRAGTEYNMKTRPLFRSGVVHFHNCKNILLRDIKFIESDNWTLAIDKCEHVVIDGVNISNNYFRTNSDAIDIVSCKNVHISNCNIVAGDDGIVLKTLDETPCERIVVTNCIIESCATGLKIGTESFGDFRYILFSNCIVKNSYGGAGIFIKDGGKAEKIKFNNCIFATYDDPYSVNLSNSICPIFLDVEKRKKDSKLGRICDISFCDINIYSENSCLMQGTKESPIENLRLKDISINVDKDFNFSTRYKPAGTIHTYSAEETMKYVRQEAYIVMANLHGVYIDNINLHINEQIYKKSPRNVLFVHKINKGIFRNVICNHANKNVPLVALNECYSIDGL